MSVILRILVSAFILAGLVGSISGCGQKGPLFIPAPAQPASAPASR